MKPKKCLVIVSAMLLIVAGNSAAAQSGTCSTQMATTIPLDSRSSHKFVVAVTNAAADTAHYAFIDTNYTKYINFNWWPSSVGADIFVGPGLYALHLSSGFSYHLATPDLWNAGIEIRVHPVFLDYVVGLGGDDGVPFHGPPYAPPGPYNLASIYGGITLNKYRAEAGVLNGNTHGQVDQDTPNFTYTAVFLGVSRRYGQYVFVEPDLRIVFPIAVHSGSQTGLPPLTEHYHLWDCFFGLHVKVGIGFN